MITKLTKLPIGIFRFSTLVPGVTPDGFTFNQFLIKADEPLLFHTGMKAFSAGVGSSFESRSH
jgi:hypothetical protein